MAHRKKHGIDSVGDHTGLSMTLNDILVGDANGLPADGGIAKGDIILKDGSVAFTQTVGGIDPSLSSDLTTKNYVDTQISSISGGIDWQESVISRTTLGPPGGESTGDRYLIDGTGTGGWVGKDDQIATYNGSGWDYQTPDDGMATYVEDVNTYYMYDVDVTSWKKFGAVVAHDSLVGAGTNSHSVIDTHLADSTIHFTEGNIDHVNILNKGTTTHAQLDTHVGDATIHFTEGSISHLNIADIGSNSHAGIDTHIADATLHFTEGSIDHLNIANNGTNSHATIDSHLADGTLHFTEASISHLNIGDIGTNNHAALDTHVADATIHFTEGSISHLDITDIGSNSHATIDTHIADSTLHFTEGSIDHTAIANIGTNTHSVIDTHLADDTKHRVINDAGTSATETWSASKTSTEIGNKQTTGEDYLIKIYSQAAEPTLTNSSIAIWIDTDDSNSTHLIFRTSGGSQTSVELA